MLVFCKFRNQCKYKPRYKLHNTIVGIRDFFWFNFHIDIPKSKIRFSKKWEELSGDYCNRCGKRIIKFFNDSYPGLCRDCGVDLDKDYGCKMLWMDMQKWRNDSRYRTTFYDFI